MKSIDAHRLLAVKKTSLLTLWKCQTMLGRKSEIAYYWVTFGSAPETALPSWRHPGNTVPFAFVDGHVKEISWSNACINTSSEYYWNRNTDYSGATPGILYPGN